MTETTVFNINNSELEDPEKKTINAPTVNKYRIQQKKMCSKAEVGEDDAI